MSEWISTADRLPEPNQQVLVWRIHDNWKWHGGVQVHISTAFFTPAKVFGNNLAPYEWKEFGPGTYFGQDVSHWMPLPEAPE